MITSADVLQGGLIARAELYQAQGMLSLQLGVDLAEAMIRLRAHAYAHNRPLIDVARDIVERRLDLTLMS
jgi:AmiR/NasT family two-component response regulator